MASKPSTPNSERPGITYQGAQALLASLGVERSIRTLRRWVARGILSVKRVTRSTTILFRDEVEAIAEAPEDAEQRILSAKVGLQRRE